MRALQTACIAASIMLVGCAIQRYDYVKEGVSQQDKDSSVSECKYQIKLNKTPAAQEYELMNLCMQGKGYRYKPV
ncbi:hypothetical protein ABID97_005410 [Variovorax sp. OAS795]|uniref:hypothetical protein n=1 Tax=Variovorax sp. OAS795 TaxID=3034231 RepID=UPI00339A2B04